MKKFGESKNEPIAPYSRYAIQTACKPYLASMSSWHKIVSSLTEIQFNACGLAEISVAGKRVCLILFKDQLYACAATCPHAGGTLADGYTDALGNIVCPVHRYKFSVKNGRNSSGEGYFLKTYPIEQRADGIYIAIEATTIPAWLK